MLFNSLQFLIFFPLVTAVYFLVRGHHFLRNGSLLVASYTFYGAWDWRFLGLIGISTLVDFYVSQRLETATERGRRWWVATSLTVNLGMLGTFKYLDFGIENFASLVERFGWQPDLATLGILLPVGISFYTFQTIGYTLDVAAGRRKAVRNLLDFALYVAYFPQLVAGPIERSTSLLPQLQNPSKPCWEDFRRGLLWVLTGYFFKVVCADTVAPYIDEAYSRVDTVGGPVLFMATLGFAVQIFCDFAGYSLIARGISEWFGIHLMENFRSPYLSQSPREFWWRWHISLSTWFRDYLYFPLGGSRKGTARTCLNLIVVFTLCGLWHGAGWNYVTFGFFWGVWLALYTLYLKAFTRRAKTLPGSLSARWIENRFPFAGPVKGVLTFGTILVSFVIFLSPDFDTALRVMSAILGDWRFDPSFPAYLRSVGFLFVGMLAYSYIQERHDDQEFLLASPAWIRWTLGAFALLSLLTVGFRPVPFFYFQF